MIYFVMYKKTHRHSNVLWVLVDPQPFCSSCRRCPLCWQHFCYGRHCIGYRKNMPCHNLIHTTHVIKFKFCNPSENPLLMIIQVVKKVWYIEVFRKGLNSLNIANPSIYIFPRAIIHRPKKTRLFKIFLIFLSNLLHLSEQNFVLLGSEISTVVC